MAALVVDEDFDIAAFARRVAEASPAYAQPQFPRLAPRLEITGAFKPRKVDLVADGFDPARVPGPLYVRERDNGYVELTRSLRDRIITGEVRL